MCVHHQMPVNPSGLVCLGEFITWSKGSISQNETKNMKMVQSADAKFNFSFVAVAIKLEPSCISHRPFILKKKSYF